MRGEVVFCGSGGRCCDGGVVIGGCGGGGVGL